MKLLLILFMITPHLTYAYTKPELKRELKTISYLQKEMESLRFRRLYAAESAKNKALTALSKKDKVQSLKSVETNTKAAQYALDITRALNDRIFEINSLLKNRNGSVNCPENYEEYTRASKYLLDLNYNKSISRNAFKYMENLYSFSNNILPMVCKTQAEY